MAVSHRERLTLPAKGVFRQLLPRKPPYSVGGPSLGHTGDERPQAVLKHFLIDGVRVLCMVAGIFDCSQHRTVFKYLLIVSSVLLTADQPNMQCQHEPP